MDATKHEDDVQELVERQNAEVQEIGKLFKHTYLV